MSVHLAVLPIGKKLLYARRGMMMIYEWKDDVVCECTPLDHTTIRGQRVQQAWIDEELKRSLNTKESEGNTGVFK